MPLTSYVWGVGMPVRGGPEITFIGKVYFSGC